MQHLHRHQPRSVWPNAHSTAQLSSVDKQVCHKQLVGAGSSVIHSQTHCSQQQLLCGALLQCCSIQQLS